MSYFSNKCLSFCSRRYPLFPSSLFLISPSFFCFFYLCVPWNAFSSPCHIRHVIPFCCCCALFYGFCSHIKFFLLPSHICHTRLPSHYSSSSRRRWRCTVRGCVTPVRIKRVRQTSNWHRYEIDLPFIESFTSEFRVYSLENSLFSCNFTS